MKKIIPIITAVLLLGGGHRAFALYGELKEPGVALSEDLPEAARKRITAALHRTDCRFLGGNFLNSFTTLRYAGETKALNMFLDALANCPGVTLSVSFVKSLPEAGDWHVHHEAHPNRFHVRVSLASEKLELEHLYLPEIAGHDPADKVGEMTLLGYEEFDQTPGRGWRSLTDQNRFVVAAKVIENYLTGHGGLEVQEVANLHFHAAQCHAFDGDPASVQQALVHLKAAFVTAGPARSHAGWNDYVIATEAFLKKDLPALRAARARVAAGPKSKGQTENLEVLDRLIGRFNRPYAEAFPGENSSKSKGSRVRF